MKKYYFGTKIRTYYGTIDRLRSFRILAFGFNYLN